MLFYSLKPTTTTKAPKHSTILPNEIYENIKKYNEWNIWKGNVKEYLHFAYEIYENIKKYNEWNIWKGNVKEYLHFAYNFCIVTVMVQWKITLEMFLFACFK